MSPVIYSSSFPSAPFHDQSVFTDLFGPRKNLGDVGGFTNSHPAYIDAITGTAVTRIQTQKLALSFGYGLRHHPSLLAKKGDTLLIYSENSLTWPVVLFGAVAAGLRCTLANNAYTAHELKHQYIDSNANLILSSEQGVATVREVLKDLGVSACEADKRIIIMADGLEWAGGPAVPVHPDLSGLLKVADLLNMGSLEDEEKFDGQLAHETVYLCYSSGTTGKPKGVETSHRNITSVLVQNQVCFPEMDERGSVLGFLPFYHIYGAILLLHLAFISGCPLVIMNRFDPVLFCAYVEKYKITVSLIVPPVLVVLARHPAVDQYDLSTLHVLFSGAAPLSAALTKQVLDRLLPKRNGKATVVISQGYGLTETSPTTHLLMASHSRRKIGSIGLLLPNLYARLVVDEDGLIDAKVGELGELWIQGPSVMKGYLNNDTATKNAITPDKWFKTGDIAMIDNEGYFYIVDRRKEIIKYKGFQVPPAELESVLFTHPLIADAAVIGVYSKTEATELPRAYVVHAQPDSIKSEAQKTAFAASIQGWIQSKVARHKFLRGGVIVTDAIPKSAAGKILRRELREQARKELEERDPVNTITLSKL